MKFSSKKKRKKHVRVGLIIVISIAALLIAGVTIGVVSYNREIEGYGATAMGSVTVTVPEGASTDTIARLLKEHGLIGSVNMFKIYSRMSGADGTFQLGDHNIAAGMTYAEVIAELQKQTVKQVETVTVTFPEGTTALKMAMMMEEKGLCTVGEFVDACNNETYDVSFYSQISHENKFIVLEGFLFPDTYEFEVGSAPRDMIQKMLENFETKVLTPERKALIEGSGYTLEEIITLASIVEKESVGEDSYAKVAAVFYNRLNSSDFPYLESDTCCDWRKRGLESMEDIYGGYFPGVLQYYFEGYDNIPEGIRDGYDSFSHPGLIVGAICNPGVIAIDGTVSPYPNWNYYFFFTGPDKQTFYWSETAAEHERQWGEVW